jgi:hypothetical protein
MKEAETIKNLLRLSFSKEILACKLSAYYMTKKIKVKHFRSMICGSLNFDVFFSFVKIPRCCIGGYKDQK